MWVMLVTRLQKSRHLQNPSCNLLPRSLIVSGWPPNEWAGWTKFLGFHCYSWPGTSWVCTPYSGSMLLRPVELWSDTVSIICPQRCGTDFLSGFLGSNVAIETVERKRREELAMKSLFDAPRMGEGGGIKGEWSFIYMLQRVFPLHRNNN